MDVLAASPPPSAEPLTEAQIEAERALLPCPFCGHSDALVTYHDPQTVLHPWYRIDCDNCGAKGPGSDRGDHVEQWNRRALPPADAAEMKRLADALESCIPDGDGYNSQYAHDHADAAAQLRRMAGC